VAAGAGKLEGPMAAARISATELGRASCNTTPHGKSRLSAEVGGFGEEAAKYRCFVSKRRQFGEEMVAQGRNVSRNGWFW